jgi:membrane protein required for colicin V production
MTWIDWIICVPLAYGFYKGFTKGFIIEFATLIALLLALYCGVKLTDFASKFLIDKFNLQTGFISIIAFACVFLCILVSVFSIAKLLELIVKITMLSLINKIFGGIFGLFKYGVLTIFLIYLLHSFNVKFNFYSEQTTSKSMLYNPSLRLSKGVITLYGDAKDVLNNFNVKPLDLKLNSEK